MSLCQLSIPVKHRFVTFVGYTVFFSLARAQVEPADRFSRFMAHTTCFRLLGLRQHRNSFRNNIPKKGRE